MAEASILWRRLDVPGHDACRLERRAEGWRLEGSAVYGEEGRPVRLDYTVDCTAAWLAQSANIHGWIGSRAVDIAVTRAERVWVLNERVVSDLEAFVDLDLGFTPATNLVQIRRLSLEVGQSADAPVAWLDVTAGSLLALPQHYERRSETTYWYEAPRFDYAGLLEVSASGLVTRYPGLWEAELEG